MNEHPPMVERRLDDPARGNGQPSPAVQPPSNSPDPWSTPRRPLFSALVAAAVVASLAIGLAAGAFWHERIRGWLGHAGHDHAAAAPVAAKQLWTCGMHPQVIQDHPGICPICGMALEPMKAEGASGMASGGAVITIDPAVVQNMGVRIAQVEQGPVRRTVRAVGYLAQAQPRVHDISLRVSGWVEKLHADTEGMRVEKGQPLFELYSPEMQVAIDELITARRAADALPADADETSRKTADVLMGAARRKLEQWGLQPSQIDQLAKLDRAPRTVPFLSPVSGEVTEKMIVEGSMVKMGERAMQLADRSLLWLDAEVYAQDLPFIKLGQKVQAEIEAMPGESYEGEVIFIHPQVDPMTRTAKVRMALDNAKLALRPGMYATASITAQLVDEALLVPREAILDTGTRQVVFVSLGEGRFEPRKIKPGPASDDGDVQVLSGLAKGDTVVTSGQFLMDAESRMKEAIQKHLSDNLLSKAPGQEGHAPPAAAVTVERIEGSAEWRSAVDSTVAAYLTLSDALGAVQKEDKPLEMASLCQAATALEQHADTESQRALAQGVLKSAKAMVGHPLEHQREQFKKLSDATVALVDVSPPSKKVAAMLFVHYCPMAPGQWLQSTEQSANPYYATEMKQCAEVKRTIEAR